MICPRLIFNSTDKERWLNGTQQSVKLNPIVRRIERFPVDLFLDRPELY